MVGLRVAYGRLRVAYGRAESETKLRIAFILPHKLPLFCPTNCLYFALQIAFILPYKLPLFCPTNCLYFAIQIAFILPYKLPLFCLTNCLYFAFCPTSTRPLPPCRPCTRRLVQHVHLLQARQIQGTGGCAPPPSLSLSLCKYIYISRTTVSQDVET